jgi:hypothetical protein
MFHWRILAWTFLKAIVKDSMAVKPAGVAVDLWRRAGRQAFAFADNFA